MIMLAFRLFQLAILVLAGAWFYNYVLNTSSEQIMIDSQKTVEAVNTKVVPVVAQAAEVAAKVADEAAETAIPLATEALSHLKEKANQIESANK